MDIPWAKLVYTAVLLGIIALLLAEAARAWRDPGVSVGTFTYHADGASKPDLGKAFGAHVVAIHHLLLHEFGQEEEIRRKEAAAAESSQILAWWPSERLPLVQPVTLLADLELKVQGFDLAKLLNWLRERVRPANEIRGIVDKTGSVLHAAVSWPEGPARGSSGDKIELRYFRTNPVTDDETLALEVAASLVWAEAAREDNELSRVSREEFVVWTRAFHHYRQLKSRLDAGVEWGEEDNSLRQRARDILDRLIKSGPVFPEVLRLRADLIRTHPDPAASELAIADEDRRKYLALVGAVATPSPTSSATVANVQRVVPIEVTAGMAVTVHGSFDWVARITGVFKDASGQRFVVLPAIPGAERAQYLSVDGSASSAIADLDRVVRIDETQPEAVGITLFRLRSSVAARNQVNGTVLAGVGSAPGLSDRVSLLAPDRRSAAQITVIEMSVPALSTSGVFVGTDVRISQNGDAGAPIVNAGGQLVAMAFAGTPTSSVLLPIKPFTEALKLTLQ